MRVRFFTVPALDPSEAEREVNRFLAAHRVLTIDRELVTIPGGAFWSLVVTYQDRPPTDARPKRGKIDYKEKLSPGDFETYAALRTLRKELAERDGVPPYAVFNNAQLAAMVELRARTPSALREIPGVGPARVDAHGAVFLAQLDRFLLEDLCVPGLVRYMDDIIVWGREGASLRTILDASRRFAAERLRLEIKPSWRLQRSQRGLTFAGLRIFPGRVRLTARRRRRYRLARSRWESAYRAGAIDAQGLQAGYASAFAMTRDADAVVWRQQQLDSSPTLDA